MEKQYCIKCGIAIKLPRSGFIENFLGNQNEPSPVEFKDGWKCAHCAKKR